MPDDLGAARRALVDARETVGGVALAGLIARSQLARKHAENLEFRARRARRRRPPTPPDTEGLFDPRVCSEPQRGTRSI